MVSKTIYLYWNKEINKEKGRYGIQETEDATQDRDEGMAKRNSRATSVQQTWRTTSPDWSQRTEKYESCPQECRHAAKMVMNFLIHLVS